MMPAIQGRMPTTNDFEDISLFDSSELKSSRRYQESNSSQDSSYSIGSSTHDDPHTSVQSVGSNLSTPTLASDVSSMRSSLSSVSSPTLAQPHYHNYSSPNIPGPPQTGKAQFLPQQHMQRNMERSDASSAEAPSLHSRSDSSHSKVYGRRRSVPTLVDNTSMASLTIKAQSGTRTRKQREKEFEADSDDEIWPTDGFMFNVPMSPALYAQQKLKQYQINGASAPLQSQSTGIQRQPVSSKHKVPEHRILSSPTSTHTPSPLHQQISGPHRRQANMRRKSLPVIDENRHRISHGAGDRLRSAGDETYPSWRNSEPQFRMASMTSLPALLSNRGSFASDANSSIDGLDPDASDLTLEFCRIEEKQRRSSAKEDTSNVSIASLALSDGDTTLPSPTMGSLRGSEDGGSDRDSRRSSLTRPENLPPKSPEEEKKHMKEYEKLLRDAAASEKRKQQKREKEAKQRAHQAKLDYAVWEQWLEKGCTTKVSSDVKWRGIPEKLRGTIWKLQKGNGTPSAPDAIAKPSHGDTVSQIARDSELMWPDCGIFGSGRPLHDSLIFVVQSFIARRPEIEYSFALTGIAALLLLYLDTGDSVDLMVNLIEPGSLVHAVLSGNERLASANYVSFGKVFRSSFERLSEHFDKVNLSDSEVLGPLIGSLFTAVLPSPEAAARVLDVYLFDGDAFLLRVSLGLLRINEAWLYASKEEILEQLMNPRTTGEDEFMDYVRNVTRN